MEVWQAEQILNEAVRVNDGRNRLFEGLKVLDSYICSEYIDSYEVNYRFSHDQMWYGAVSIEKYAEIMTPEDIKKMGRWGWFIDEESWSLFS